MKLLSMHHHHHHLVMMKRFMSTLNIQIKIKELVCKRLYDQTLQVYRDELSSSSNGTRNGLHAILPSIIKACSSSQSKGLQLHCVALKSGSNLDPVVSNSLISLYAKLGLVEASRQVFDEMPQRDTVTWNAMINCYIQNGQQLTQCLQLLKRKMHSDGFALKPELAASIVSVCARKREFRLGRQIHGLLLVNNAMIDQEESVLLSTALVDFYMRCHQTLMALHIFYHMEMRNEVSWTAMISGCIANHGYEMAMDCFREMQVEGVRPNRVTMLAILPACAELGDIRHGKEIHAYALRHGFESDHHCSAALIHMYCKRGKALRPAKLIFDSVSVKDVVMWSLMIGSYSRCGNGVKKALKLFNQMQAEGITPNSVTLLAVISACTSLSSLHIGSVVHSHVIKSGLNSDIFIGNALINMYAKCGCLAGSRQVFKEMPSRDSVTWSTMIESYGIHGLGNKAVQLFLEMQERDIHPDGVAYLSVLSACNHAGLVEEGKKIFKHMIGDNEIHLTLEHYACYINLLGKFGKLEDACEVMRSMPMKPSSKIWSCLVTACKVHGISEKAESWAHELIRSEPENAGNYTLLSMVHAEAGNWLGVEEVRKVMRLQGLRKCYGFSRI